jgi:hypothetical protein
MDDVRFASYALHLQESTGDIGYFKWSTSAFHTSSGISIMLRLCVAWHILQPLRLGTVGGSKFAAAQSTRRVPVTYS